MSQFPNQPNQYPGQPNQYPNQPNQYPGQPNQYPNQPQSSYQYPQQGYPQQPNQQYPQQPYYPPLQEPRKKNKLLLILGIIVGLSLLSCIGFSIIGAANANKTSGSTTATTSTKAQDSKQTSVPTSAPPSNPHFKIGDTVKVDDTFQVTVNSAKTNQGDDFNKPTKNGDTFIMVDVTLKNLSSKEQSISSLLQFHLHDTDGQQYTETINTNATTPDGKLEAGDTLKGTLTYEVPSSKHQYVFAFEADVMQSGQTQWDVAI